MRIELTGVAGEQTDSVMSEEELFQTALNKNGESFKLWSAYVQWIEKQWQDDALTSDNVGELMTVSYILNCLKVVMYLNKLLNISLSQNACRKATSLLPSLVDSTAERNRIKDYVLGSYVVLSARINGIKKARETYKRLINNSFPTLAFYKACLQVEEEYGKSHSAVNQSQYLYEMALRLNIDREGMSRPSVSSFKVSHCSKVSLI